MRMFVLQSSCSLHMNLVHFNVEFSISVVPDIGKKILKQRHVNFQYLSCI